MNKFDTSKNAMIELLDLINEQAEMLKTQKGEIPQLYIDLLKKNVLKLYETIHILDQIKHLEEDISKSGQTNPEKVIKSVKEDTIVTQIKEHEPIVEIKQSEPEPPKPDIVQNTDPIIKPKLEPAIKDDHEMPVVSFSLNRKTESQNEKEVFIHPNSDLFSEAKKNLADKLSEGQDPRLADRIQQNKISDIKAAIGINEKFLFINELFAGDLKIYNQSIDKLNLANNYHGAISTFNQFKEQFGWDEKDEVVIKLKTIVNRKYSIS
ncbi:MAG: hypothetical protein KKG99_15655 [Bacteroidetes bacterium]|nr:hypothetical protein [Bacteroidota bacterium]